METLDESVNLVEDYLGIDRRTLKLLLAIAACALVATTGIYIHIYGLQRWRTNMDRAGEAMVIDFEEPAASRAAARYVCPGCGTVEVSTWSRGEPPRCPICGGRLSPR